MEKQKNTPEQAPASAPAAQNINLLEVLQSKEFESDIVGAANMLNRNAAARLRAYRYPNGIWNPAGIAREYREIMMKQSSAPSTVRGIIVSVGKYALSKTLCRIANRAHAEVKIVQPGKKPE